LTPFTTVAGTDVIASDEPVEDIQESMIVDTDDQMTLAKKRKINGISVGAQAVKA